MRYSAGSALESNTMDNMIYLDSHAHVFSDDFDEDRMEMIQRAKDRGVTLLNIMCTSTEEAYRAMEYISRSAAASFRPTSMI